MIDEDFAYDRADEVSICREHNQRVTDALNQDAFQQLLASAYATLRVNTSKLIVVRKGAADGIQKTD